MKVDINKIIGTSDFRSQTARIFDEVEAGATFLITRGSKPIAVIGPVPADIASPSVATTFPSGEAWQNEAPTTAQAPATQQPQNPSQDSWQNTNPAVTNDPIDIE